MRVNLNQLCVFYLTARHNSMTVAADLLYVSKPAVSMQIKKMEDWLGFPLFERESGKLRLTERGQGLYEVLEPIFGNLEKLEQYIHSLVQAEEVELKLGTHHLPGNYFIPDLISHAYSKYPRLKLQMELGTQDALLEKLLQHKLDLVLMIGAPPPAMHCRSVPLFAVNLALVTAAGNAYSKLNAISVKELPNLPLILPQRGTGARSTLLQFFTKHEVQPNVLQDNISSDVGKQFLLREPSCAFIARFIVERELNEGLFHEIKVAEGLPVFHFHIAYLDRQYLPIKILDFIEAIRGFSPRFPTLA